MRIESDDPETSKKRYLCAKTIFIYLIITRQHLQGRRRKCGKNESFCEGMVKALITKMIKSGKNEPFCEGMVKALFSKKSQKSVQKSAQNRGQPCRRLASQ